MKTLKKRKVDGAYVEYCWSFAIGKCTNANCHDETVPHHDLPRTGL